MYSVRSEYSADVKGPYSAVHDSVDLVNSGSMRAGHSRGQVRPVVRNQAICGAEGNRTRTREVLVADKRAV